MQLTQLFLQITERLGLMTSYRSSSNISLCTSDKKQCSLYIQSTQWYLRVT